MNDIEGEGRKSCTDSDREAWTPPGVVGLRWLVDPGAGPWMTTIAGQWDERLAAIAALAEEPGPPAVRCLMERKRRWVHSTH